MWLLIAAFPLCNMLSANMVNFHRGKLDIKEIAVIRLTQVGVWVALNLTFFAIGTLNLQTAVLSMVLSQAIGAVVGISAGLSYGRRGMRVYKPVGKTIRRYARHAFLGIAVRDLNVYVDQLIIALFLGPGELGLYAVAVSLTASLGLLSGPITNTIQPVMQSARIDERVEVAAKALGATLLVLGIPGILLAATAAIYVPFIYGSAFAGAVPLIQLLVIASIVDGLNSCCHGVLLGAGHPLRGSVSAGVGLVATAAFLVVFMPLIGVEGAAIASIGAYMIVLAFMLRAVTKSLGSSVLALTIAVVKCLPLMLATGPSLLRKRLRRMRRREDGRDG